MTPERDTVASLGSELLHCGFTAVRLPSALRTLADRSAKALACSTTGIANTSADADANVAAPTVDVARLWPLALSSDEPASRRVSTVRRASGMVYPCCD